MTRWYLKDTILQDFLLGMFYWAPPPSEKLNNLDSLLDYQHIIDNIYQKPIK